MRKIGCAALAALLLSAVGPGVGSAQTNPRIMLEKSPAYALNNEVRAFRVPVTNSAGTIRFFDVVVRLTVNAQGIVAPSAVVSATASPSVTTGVIPPGTYRASDGTVCTATNITLQGGRIQSFFNCVRANAPQFSFNVTTGTVTSGHPHLAQLTAASITKLGDVGTYTWGVVTGVVTSQAMAGCVSFVLGNTVGAKTNGNVVALSVFLLGQPNPTFQCGVTLTKQP